MFHPSGWHENKDNLFHPRGELVGEHRPPAGRSRTYTYLFGEQLPAPPSTTSASSNVSVKHPQADIYFSPWRPEPRQAPSAEEEEKVLETRHRPECILHV